MRTVVYATGVGGKNSAMDGKDVHEVDKVVPIVRSKEYRAEESGCTKKNEDESTECEGQGS